MTVIDEAERAHTEGWLGRFSRAEELCARLDAEGSADAAAWALALRAQRHLAEPLSGAEPDESAIARLLDGPKGVKRPLALACTHASRARWLAFDGEDVVRLASLHERIGDSWSAVTLGYAALARGEIDESRTRADEAYARGSAKNDAALVVEAASLRALVLVTSGDLEAGLSAARRASRMARTEAFPQGEYLANTILARARRLSGKPHLGTLILSALARVAPAPWQPWLAWELTLSQGLELRSPDRAAGAAERAEAGVAALRAMLGAASTGDLDALPRAWDEAAAATCDVAPFGRDVSIVGALLDPRAQSNDAAVDAFTAGSADAVPYGLHGISPATTTPEHAVETALVVVGPDVAPRRALSVALGLVRQLTGGEPLPPAKGRQARTESTLAALALAGERGVDEEALFGRVYGFAYDAALHRGVRDVLYHRVRERLADLGELERSDGRARVRFRSRVLVPDPRCSPPPEQHLLRVLARLPRASAKDAAAALGIPLRTAQEALGRLAEDGALVAEKRGKKIEYRLEDTTFAEPTQL